MRVDSVWHLCVGTSPTTNFLTALHDSLQIITNYQNTQLMPANHDKLSFFLIFPITTVPCPLRCSNFQDTALDSALSKRKEMVITTLKFVQEKCTVVGGLRKENLSISWMAVVSYI